jgi:DNA polymerase-3 subunit beta
MKFRIGREEWLGGLQAALGAVDRKQAVPILGNFLVRAREGEVVVWGTDLEVEVRAAVSAEVLEEGETTVPGRKLWEIWRNLPGGSLAEVTTGAGRATFKVGSSRFTLSTLEAEAFPATEEFEASVAFRVPGEELRAAMEGTQFAMAQQDVRFYLNGLLLETRGKAVRVVGTDGHRLALCEMELGGVEWQELHQAIMPRKAVNEMLRLASVGEAEVLVEVGSQSLRATAGGLRLVARLVEGRYPEYERVIPDREVWDKHVVVDREALRQALVRAAILANERYRAVRLSLQAGRVRIQAENAEREEAEEEVDVEYQGGSLDIGFNVTYLVDALSAVRGERVRLYLQDENSSCLVEGEGAARRCRYVVMPMRL